MADKTKLNGGVDALAKAMRQVFTEALDATAQPLKESMDGLRTDMGDLRTDLGDLRTDLSDQIETTNKNMSAQFAEQERKFGLKERSKTA